MGFSIPWKKNVCTSYIKVKEEPESKVGGGILKSVLLFPLT